MTQQSDWIKEREAIRARLDSATPGPWTHFYPEHREAKSGVIRPPTVHDLVIGNVTIDGGSASGLRYQVEGYGKVNGQDRYSIATISPPRPRNTSDWDGIGKEASALAFKHVEADGELIAHAPEDLRRLLARVDEVEAENADLRRHDAQSRESGCWCDEHGHPCKGCELKQKLSGLNVSLVTMGGRGDIPETVPFEALDGLECVKQALASREQRINELNGLLQEVLNCGIEFDDARLAYKTIQIDKVLIAALEAARSRQSD